MKKSKEKKMHQYIESGLDYIFLMNGFEADSHPEIGETVSIHDIDGLNRLITKLIIDKIPQIRGQEVRFLRSELRLTQTQMGILLGHTLRTIQRWEEDKNTSIPEIADGFLRLFCAAHIDGKDMTRKVCKMLKEAQKNLEKKDEPSIDRIDLLDTGRGWKAA